MKRAILTGLSALVLSCAIPALMLRAAPARHVPAEASAGRPAARSPAVPELTQPSFVSPVSSAPEPLPGADSTVLVSLLDDDAVLQLPLDAYLTGVLLAEMPASFAPEALKAQAVVARTYTLRRMKQRRHENAAVCSDPACCQGWLPEDRCIRSASDPEQAKAQAAQMLQAVQETDGLVLTYNGELIDATFFSCSGGRTEDAAAVWGSDVPYLQAVDSPGEDSAAHYLDTEEFTAANFAERLRSGGKQPDLSGDPEKWFGAPTYTDGGGVDSISIGGVIYTGTELRRLLGLRSTVFSLEARDGVVTACTRGFGHRVGMSQYGAQAMAEAGSAFSEILTHYYTGVAVSVFDSAAVTEGAASA